MEKIKKLKKLFNNFNLDGYIVPKNDEFFSEYVSKDKDNLKYITNFTGSYGFALMLKKKNYLFVDGRYTNQAEIEAGKLFKIITLPKKFPFDLIKKKNLKIGFDPRLHTHNNLNRLFKKKVKLLPILDNLIDKVKLKKKLSTQKKYFILGRDGIGKNVKNKINIYYKYLKKNKKDLIFISAPENVSWVLNIRGRDSEFSPIANAYLIIDKNKKIFLFLDLKKISKKFRKKFKFLKILDINNLDIFLKNINNKKILVDINSCSIFYENILKQGNEVKKETDLTYLLKAIKTSKEILNTRKTHLIDGIALTRFLLWIKNNYKRKKISEISAQEKLLSFRRKNKNFNNPSFPTISGSGPNGAIIHYRANKKSNRILRKGDIYLIDSGGQYNYGTTDVTRTISLGNHNQRIKKIFTMVLKGHIAVSSFNISGKTIGSDIDRVARKPLNSINLDYPHGTGHGVGYFLNVHEGPQSLTRGNKVVLKEGMIVSNEPGYYEKNKFGIRIENLIVVQRKKAKLYFENLTLAPIDTNLIDKNLLNSKEKNWINNYHKNIFDKFKDYFKNNELKELQNLCSNI